MKDMKQILLKFSRSIDRNPTSTPQTSQDSSLDWPNDIVRLECVAQHLRSVSQHVSKKAHLCYPSVQVTNLSAPLSLEASGATVSAATTVTPLTTSSNNNTHSRNGIFATRRSKSEGVALADDREKRLHRLPEAVLARLVMDSAVRFEDTACSVNLRSMFQHLGTALRFLAENRLTMELEVEQGLLQRLHQCAYLQVPALIKGRKQFCKLYLEWRNLSQRLHVMEATALAQQQQQQQQVTQDVESTGSPLQSAVKSSEMCKSQSSLTSMNGILKSASGAIKSVKNGAKEKRSRSKGATPRLEISAPMNLSSNLESMSNTAIPLHVNVDSEQGGGGTSGHIGGCDISGRASDETVASHCMPSSGQLSSNSPPVSQMPISNASTPIVLEKAKVQQLRAMKEELETSLTQCKDQALKDFYRFDCSLVGYADTFATYLVQLSDYHRRCAAYLDEVAQKMREEMAMQCKIPVFGRPLEEHLEMTNRSVAYVIDICCRELSSPRCLLEEGIFRTAGSKVKVDTLVSALNVMRAEQIISQFDPYVIADALKQYLRSLPVSLLCNHMRDDWHLSIQLPNVDDQLRSLWNCCCRLPGDYWCNLGHVMRMLHTVSQHAAQNRMPAANLGIVLAPTLLPSSDSCEQQQSHYEDVSTTSTRCEKVGASDHLSARVAAGSMSNLVIELLITYANSFFPEDVEQYLVLPPTSSTPMPTYATVRRVPAKSKVQPTTSTVNSTLLKNIPPSWSSSSASNRFTMHSSAMKSPPQTSMSSSYATSAGPVRAAFCTKHHTSFAKTGVNSGTAPTRNTTTHNHHTSILTSSLDRPTASTGATPRSPSSKTGFTCGPRSYQYPSRYISFGGVLGNTASEDEDSFCGNSYSLAHSSATMGRVTSRSCRRTSDGQLMSKATDASGTSHTAPDSEADPDTLDDGENLPSDGEEDEGDATTSSCPSVGEDLGPLPQRSNRSFHADMYDTLFALQSIRSNPWIIANNANAQSTASEPSTASLCLSSRFAPPRNAGNGGLEASPTDFIQKMRRVYEERQFCTPRSSLSEGPAMSREVNSSSSSASIPWSSQCDPVDNNSQVHTRRIVRSKAALSMVLPNQISSPRSDITNTGNHHLSNLMDSPGTTEAFAAAAGVEAFHSSASLKTGNATNNAKNAPQRHSMPARMLSEELHIPPTSPVGMEALPTRPTMGHLPGSNPNVPSSSPSPSPSSNVATPTMIPTSLKH